MPLRWTIHVAGRGFRVRGCAAELSRQGIFVRCRTNVGVREGEHVELTISGSGLTVTTDGTVVHDVRGQGLGIRFSKQTPRARGVLELLRNRAQGTQFRVSPGVLTKELPQGHQ